MFSFLKKSPLPQINIQYGKLLDPIFNFYLKNNPDLKESGWNDWVPPAREIISERIKKYRHAWEERKKIILREICKVTGLNFNRDVIDVYIISGNNRQLSCPIVIKSGYAPDEFVDILSHELIHRLFNINSKIVYGNIFKEMFPNESETTQEHVIVHSILKYIYLDVFNEKERLERDQKNSTKNKDYSRSWDIVEEIGYKNLIKNFILKIKAGRS